MNHEPMNQLMDDQLRTEFNEWARAGKGDSMERSHRPIGEQANCADECWEQCARA